MLKKIKTSLPFTTILILATLAVPRVIVHDLRLLSFDSPAYKALAVVPFAIWIYYAVSGKSKRPVYDFLVLGLVFGLMLAVSHQITWTEAWSNNPPNLSGNLEGKLDPAVEDLVIRAGAFFSSLFTGFMLGAISALIAVIATKVRPNKAPKNKK